MTRRWTVRTRRARVTGLAVALVTLGGGGWTLRAAAPQSASGQATASASAEGIHGALRILSTPAGSRIGVSVEDPRANDAAGARVTAVTPGSPAADAGVETGDRIVTFDGERVRSARQLARLVSETPAGRSVPAEIDRDGRRLTVEVAPEAGASWVSALTDQRPEDLIPDLSEVRRRYRRVVPSGGGDFAFDLDAWSGRRRLGVEVHELSPQLADFFGVDDGLLVASVTSGSVAERAGLAAGDVILAVDGAEVTRTSSLRRRLGDQELDESFEIRVMREGTEVLLEGRFEDTRPRWRQTI